MSQEGEQTQAPNPSGASNGAVEALRRLASAPEESVGPGDETASQSQAVEPLATSEDGAVDDSVEIAFDEGVSQKFSKQELRKLIETRQQLDAERRVAQQMLQKGIAERSIADKLAEYDPDTRQQILEVVFDPSRLQSGKRVTQSEQSALDDVFEDAGQSADPQLLNELRALRQKVQGFEQYQQAELRERQIKDADSQLDRALDRVQTFRTLKEQGQEAALDLARDAIRTHLMSNPQADMDETVRNYAVRWQKVYASRAAVRPSPDPRASQSFRPDKAPSYEDLRSGRIADQIRQKLGF